MNLVWTPMSSYGRQWVRADRYEIGIQVCSFYMITKDGAKGPPVGQQG